MEDPHNSTPRRSAAVLMVESASPTIAISINARGDLEYDPNVFREFVSPHRFAGRAVGEVFLDLCQEVPELMLAIQRAPNVRAALHDIGLLLGSAAPAKPPAAPLLTDEIAELVRSVPSTHQLLESDVAFREFSAVFRDENKFPKLHAILREFVVSNRVAKSGRAAEKIELTLAPVCALLNILSQKTVSVANVLAFYLSVCGLTDAANNVLQRFGLTTSMKTLRKYLKEYVTKTVEPRVNELCHDPNACFIIDNVELSVKVAESTVGHQSALDHYSLVLVAKQVAPTAAPMVVPSGVLTAVHIVADEACRKRVSTAVTSLILHVLRGIDSVDGETVYVRKHVGGAPCPTQVEVVELAKFNASMTAGVMSVVSQVIIPKLSSSSPAAQPVERANLHVAGDNLTFRYLETAKGMLDADSGNRYDLIPRIGLWHLGWKVLLAMPHTTFFDPYVTYAANLMHVKGLKPDVGVRCDFNGPNRVGHVLFRGVLLGAWRFYRQNVAQAARSADEQEDDFAVWIELNAIVDTDVDDATHDSCRLIWLYGLYNAFSSAVKHNDGHLIVDILRYALPFQMATRVGTTHYLSSTVSFLSSLFQMPEADREMVLHNLTASPKGKPGRNIALDLLLEHFIKPLRACIRTSNPTDAQLHLAARTVALQRRICPLVEELVGASSRSTTHSMVDVSRDIELLAEHAKVHWFGEMTLRTPAKGNKKTKSCEFVNMNERALLKVAEVLTGTKMIVPPQTRSDTLSQVMEESDVSGDEEEVGSAASDELLEDSGEDEELAERGDVDDSDNET